MPLESQSSQLSPAEQARQVLAIPKFQKSERGAGAITKGRAATTSALEDLYNKSGMLIDAPARQQFLKKVGAMSAEELRLFDLSFKKAGEALKNPKTFESFVLEARDKSYKPEDVKARQKIEHQREIDQARARVEGKFGGAKTPTQETPKDDHKLEGNGWHEVDRPKSTGSMVEEVSEPDIAPPAKEPSKQDVEKKESKVENPFQSLADSPEDYFNRLEDDRGGLNAYAPKKAIRAVMEVLQKLYPDSKKRAARIQEIFGQYSTIRDDNRKNRPEAEESNHQNFGINQTVQRLSDAEKQALEQAIEEKINTSERTFAGVSKTRFTKEAVLGSFIEFLEGLKK